MNLVRRYIKAIFEMAEERKSAIQDLRSLSRPYTDHVCKMFLWSDQNKEWQKDWADEIYNYIRQISGIVLKGNKRLKRKDYEQFFFFHCLEAEWEFSFRIDSASKHFQDFENYPTPSQIDVESSYNRYKEFVNLVLQDVERQCVDYCKVQSLCSKYLTGKEY